MGKKKDDDDEPEIARTAKVTKGWLKGHTHRYRTYPQGDGKTYYVCIAGDGCTHAYTK